MSLVVVAALVLIASVGVGLRVRSRAAAAAMLPPLPDLAGQPPAVVEHLRNADAQARRDPASADAVGALGMAYHADLFYDAAADAYRAAAGLSPGDWRWSYSLVLVHLERGEAAEAAARLREIVAVQPGSGAGVAAARRRGVQARALRGSRRGVRPRGGGGARSEGIRRGRGRRIAGAARHDSGGRIRRAGTARVALQQGDVDRARQSLEKLVARCAALRRRASPARRHLSSGSATPTRRRATWPAPRRCRPTTPRRIRWSTRWRANRAAACCCSSRRARPIWSATRRGANISSGARSSSTAPTRTSSTRWARCCSS